MTLIELIVVLVILGIGMGVATLGVKRSSPPPEPALQDQIMTARRDAIESARTITLNVPGAAGVAMVTITPAGTVIADSATGVDPWTGRVR